jgi:hypothetical protein
MSAAESPRRLGAKRWNIVVAAVVAVTFLAVVGRMWLSSFKAEYAAVRRNTTSARLKLIALAMHTYEGQNGQLPATAIYSRDGKPLLSWRVVILPFIDEKALYEQFHLDEPWNSPHNAALISKMPDMYQPPAGEYKDTGKTCYLAPVGEKVAFNGSKGRSSWTVGHYPDRTILVVEAARDPAVEWTKPSDLPFDENDPWAGLRDSRDRGLMVLYLDGGVEEIPTSTPNDALNRLFFIAGARAGG